MGHFPSPKPSATSPVPGKSSMTPVVRHRWRHWQLAHQRWTGPKSGPPFGCLEWACGLTLSTKRAASDFPKIPTAAKRAVTRAGCNLPQCSGCKVPGGRCAPDRECAWVGCKGSLQVTARRSASTLAWSASRTAVEVCNLKRPRNRSLSSSQVNFHESGRRPG